MFYYQVLEEGIRNDKHPSNLMTIIKLTLVLEEGVRNDKYPSNLMIIIRLTMVCSISGIR